MPRPKSLDPKRAVTLRLSSSELSEFEAMGSGYRAKMEAVLSASLKAKAELVRVAPRAKPILAKPPSRKHVSRLKGEWKAP
jgi:hypothetical protein